MQGAGVIRHDHHAVIPLNRKPRKHFLWSCEGDTKGPAYELASDSLTIGRAEDMDICLDSSAVSRQHARLTRVDGEYTILDMESRHGIFLNGLRVHSAVLRDGDIVQLGPIVFIYEEG